MTWTRAFRKAAIWVCPNAVPALAVMVVFYLIGVDEPGPWEGLVQILLFVSLGCLIAIPVAAGLIQHSRKVALVAALCEAVAVGGLTGLYFDFFGGWVPRGFHP